MKVWTWYGSDEVLFERKIGNIKPFFLFSVYGRVNASGYDINAIVPRGTYYCNDTMAMHVNFKVGSCCCDVLSSCTIWFINACTGRSRLVNNKDFNQMWRANTSILINNPLWSLNVIKDTFIWPVSNCFTGTIHTKCCEYLKCFVVFSVSCDIVHNIIRLNIQLIYVDLCLAYCS